MPPLLNANAVIQCAHGGKFVVVPRGPRPLVGGAPALNVQDFPGVISAGCVFNVAGAPVPCVIVSVIAGMCPTILVGGGAGRESDTRLRNIQRDAVAPGVERRPDDGARYLTAIRGIASALTS